MSACALTELGLVSALGCGRDETLSHLRANAAPGMRPIALAGGETSFFGFATLPAPAFAAAPTRVAALLDAAVTQLDLAALYRDVPPDRVGAVVGTSNSTMEEFTDNPDRIDMAYPVERLKEKWGVKGPAWCVSTACSSSAKVFASARRLLEAGLCDAVLVGGADAHTRTVVEGFHALESLASGRTRPLAPDRDGINLGEGAAVFVMRRSGPGMGPMGRMGHLGRNADSPDVELLGVGESSDAYHLTAPDPEGGGAEAAMRAALADAALRPGDVSFINLHGTGTVYNDAMEMAAVRRVFGRSVCAFSTKPLTGHCLGAAGAVEAALCWLALRERKTPCRALSNSFAFGGSNATVILANGRL